MNTFLCVLRTLVEMMGFGRSANCALWSPSALTVHRTVIHYLLCSNPYDSSFRVRFWLVPYLMVEMMGFEPMTPCLQGRCSPNWATPPDFSWDFAVSPFFIFAKQKFHPLADFIHLWISFSLCENFIAILWIALVGPSGLEPPTSCLSGTRSNLLSYEPMWLVKWFSFHLVFAV